MKALSTTLIALTLASHSRAQAPPSVTNTEPPRGSANQSTLTGLDSATAWPWRVLVVKSRLRQQEEVRAWLPTEEGDSVALGIACVGGSVNLAIVPPSFAAVEGVVPVGRQLGSIVQVSYRWEDSTIHQADFVTQGGGRVLWHVFHDPFGANDYFPSPKLAEQLGRHHALVAEWPSLNGTTTEASWSLPLTTQTVIVGMKRTCRESKH